jgi:site-specific recombinase XerD
MSTEIILSPAPALQPAPLFTPTPKVARRILEFFTAQVNNDHTRKAYLNTTRQFAEWCDARRISQLADVQAFHVAAFIKELQRDRQTKPFGSVARTSAVTRRSPTLMSSFLRFPFSTQTASFQRTTSPTMNFSPPFEGGR